MSYNFGINKFSVLNPLCILLLHLLEMEKVESLPLGRILDLPQGKIKGRLSESRNGSFFMEYMGIPYCQEPKRFKPCRWPPPSWDTCKSTDEKCTVIRDGTHPGSKCFQMSRSHKIGDENCLFLNVATPANPDNYFAAKDMPVLVVFHGGSWMVDRGDWVGGHGDQLGAKHLIDEFVVVVTVNFRLGVLGFFSTFNSEGPANLGLKDQVMALKWVQKYIHLFGGNADSVTIVGQGSGAAAVGLHLVSPLSKGLFHKAIMQSGSPLCHWSLVDDIKPTGVNKYLQELGCIWAFDEDNKINATGALACLESKDPQDLEEARQKLNGLYDDPFYLFGPVVEHWVRTYPNLQVFLPDYPLNILLNATKDTWGGIPIMMGVNSQDGLTFVNGQYLYNPAMKDLYFYNYTKAYPPNFGYGLSRDLPVAKTEDQQKLITQKIVQFYYKENEVDPEKISGRAYHQTHIDMYSHRNYFHCVRRAAEEFAKFSDVFLYYFSRKGSTMKEWYEYENLNLTHGAANGDETHYLFDTSDDFGDFDMIRRAHPKNLLFSINVVKLWVHFATYGMPNKDWKSMKGKKRGGFEWFELGDKEKTMINEPFKREADFWDDLGLDEPRELPPPEEKRKRKRPSDRKDHEDNLGRMEPPDEGFVYVDLEEDKIGRDGIKEDIF